VCVCGVPAHMYMRARALAYFRERERERERERFLNSFVLLVNNLTIYRFEITLKIIEVKFVYIFHCINLHNVYLMYFIIKILYWYYMNLSYL
jgi:hypothetical protein